MSDAARTPAELLHAYVRQAREMRHRIAMQAEAERRLAEAERALIRRLKRALCGVEGCCCSNAWGER